MMATSPRSTKASAAAPGAEDDAADELIDEIEQVRRHQVMLHRLIAEA